MTGLKPALCDQRENSSAVSAWYIAGRLGHREKAWSWVKAQIEAMMGDGFPPPIILYDCSPRVPRPKPREGIFPSSRWDKRAVDLWFDGQPSAFVPPQVAESASAALVGHYANDLDARARALGGAR
jgi:hypothetical protein